MSKSSEVTSYSFASTQESWHLQVCPRHTTSAPATQRKIKPLPDVCFHSQPPAAVRRSRRKGETQMVILSHSTAAGTALSALSAGAACQTMPNSSPALASSNGLLVAWMQEWCKTQAESLQRLIFASPHLFGLNTSNPTRFRPRSRRTQASSIGGGRHRQASSAAASKQYPTACWIPGPSS